MRHGLVHADLLAELLARRRVLERVLEREPRDAARLERERRLRARLDLGKHRGLREPLPGLTAAHDSERTRLIRRREDFTLSALELVDPVAADDRNASRGVEVGNERAERERPARLAGCDLGAELRGKRRQRQPDRREVRTAIQRRARAPRREPPPRGMRARRHRLPPVPRRLSSRAPRPAPRSAPGSPRGTRAPAREARPARV